MGGVLRLDELTVRKRRAGSHHILVLLLLCLFSQGFSQPQTLDSLQRKFSELRFGMFLHFNMNTFSPGWGNARVNPHLFSPTSLNCGQWAKAAVAAGMKYAVLTCKHHDGFTLWPSKQVPPNGLPLYTVAQSSIAGRDVVREYVDSCRAYGILPGLYSSMWDVANGVDTSWAQDSSFVLGQLTELLGGDYGEVPLFMYDGWEWRMGHRKFPYERVRSCIKTLQPNCLIIEHNGLTSPFESDVINYEAPKGVYCDPNNTYAALLSTTITSDSATLMGGTWFWASKDSHLDSLMSVAAIVHHLNVLEPRHCNFLLDCPPNRQGLLDTAIVRRLAQVGQAWHPDTARPPLPTQMHNVEYPIRPDTAIASSEVSYFFRAMQAVDGKTDVNNGGVPYNSFLWKSDTNAALPQYITLDLGHVYENIDIFGYLPRQDLTDFSGRITRYKILVGTDTITFDSVAGGSWSGLDRRYRTVTFTPVAARYVRLEADSCVGADGISPKNFVTASEVDVGGWAEKPTVGVLPTNTRAKTYFVNERVFCATGREFIVPEKYLKGNYSAAIYDVGGKMLYKQPLTRRVFDLGRNSDRSFGVYIIKINAVR